MEGKSKKKQSNLPLLSGLLVVLALIAFALADPLHLLHPTAEKQAAKDPERKLLLDAKRDQITALEVTPIDGDPYRLEKDKDKWYVVVNKKRTKADMDRVEQILTDLPQLRADSLATEDPKQYDELEASDGKAIMLKVYTGSPTPAASFHVGKAAPGYQTSFVRLNDGKEVWRAGKNVKSLFGYSAADYRTKKPWALKPETATKLSVQRFTPGKEDEKTHTAPPPDAAAPKLEFESKDGIWKTSDSPGNQNSIKEFLHSLGDLQISEYVDHPDPAVTKLAGRAPSIAVTAADGDYSLTFGGKDQTYWYVQDQDGNVYKVSDYSLNFYKSLDWSKLTFDDTKSDIKPGVQPPVKK